MKTVLFRLSVFFYFLGASSFAQLGKSLVTDDFSQVESTVNEILTSADPKNVLVVFDIDNTLLKTVKDFGSEHWFLWQKSLLEGGKKELPLVADSIGGVLKVQTAIYAVSGMVPTDLRIPSFFNNLKSLGVSRITLTSRGLEVRDSTLREIEKNKISLSGSKELQIIPTDGPYLPYNLMQAEAYGLTPKDVNSFSLKEARPVLFERGVFLTDGQHKGVMLKTLLARSQRTFTDIIFVDDRPHHVQGMSEAFAERREKLHGIHFNKSALWTQLFNESDKLESSQAWCAFGADLARAGLGLNGLFLCP